MTEEERRQLNERAAKCMGWKKKGYNGTLSDTWHDERGMDTMIFRFENIDDLEWWNPLEDLNQAMELVKKLPKKDCWWRLIPHQEKYKFTIILFGDPKYYTEIGDEGKSTDAIADTPEEAIVKAVVPVLEQLKETQSE